MTLPSCVVSGVDASPESLAALDLALELATVLGARLIAVHAVGLLEEGGYRPRLDLRAVLEDARTRLGRTVTTSVDLVQEDGVPADVVVRVAKRERADLIVVGSRGVGGALRQLGSTSEALVSHAAVPILVVPSSRERDAG
jgi:nucleotide-binding universal stress UspA family protein